MNFIDDDDEFETENNDWFYDDSNSFDPTSISDSYANYTEEEYSSDSNDESLFVGEKYIEIYNSKFSVYACIFGYIYFLYRKMIIEAVIICVSKSILLLMFLAATSSFIIPILIFIIYAIAQGFLFTKLYKNFVKRTIYKVKTDRTNEDLKQKGGISTKYMMIGIVICIIISSMVATVGARVVKLDKYKKEDSYSSSSTNTTNNKKNNTNTAKDKYTISSNLDKDDDDDFSLDVGTSGTSRKVINEEVKVDISKDVDKYITYSIPDGFEKDSNGYSLKENNNINYSSCDFYFVKNEYDPKIYLDRVAMKNEIDRNEVYSAEVNGIEWWLLGIQNDETNQLEYYNAAKINGNVLMYTYKVNMDEMTDEINGYFEEIIYSIELKNNSTTGDKKGTISVID